MYDVEQEIIDRLRDQCRHLFETIASNMAIHESENERDLCPAVFVSIDGDNALSYAMRYMEVDQSWTITLALASHPDSSRREALAKIDDGRKLAIINALTVGWKPPNARDPIIYENTGPIYSEFGYVEIPMTFRTKSRYPT